MTALSIAEADQRAATGQRHATAPRKVTGGRPRTAAGARPRVVTRPRTMAGPRTKTEARTMAEARITAGPRIVVPLRPGLPGMPPRPGVPGVPPRSGGAAQTGRPAQSGLPVRPAKRPGPAGPVRLTRRGRVVLAGLAITVGAVALCLLSLAAAGGAQAASHGAARAGYRGMRQVVVDPGQTLWSLASAAEPAADPRAVIQQIIEANSLAGGTIQAGQVLWVPKG